MFRLISKVFFAFTGDGFNVIDAERRQIVATVPHNVSIQGTNQKMCTPNLYRRTKCAWQGATRVGDKYIFAADSSGNRVIVIDIAQRRPIKAISTHGFPYEVTYLKSLDEVWVLCWRRNILDVVGDGSGTMIQKIQNASSLVIRHSIQAQASPFVKIYECFHFHLSPCLHEWMSSSCSSVSFSALVTTPVYLLLSLSPYSTL